MTKEDSQWDDYQSNELISMKHGFDLYLRPKCEYSRKRFIYKIAESNEIDYLIENWFPFISRHLICLDIGANIGTTVLSLSKQVGENGQVLAFEPQNHIAQCLNTNLTINGITNVIVDNAAISKKCGWAKINDKDNANNEGLEDEPKTPQNVDIEPTDLDSKENQEIEKILRKIPDDPGGLLRNKFRYQKIQRYREKSAPNKKERI